MWHRNQAGPNTCWMEMSDGKNREDGDEAVLEEKTEDFP